jgi:hypothetical protein
LQSLLKQAKAIESELPSTTHVDPIQHRRERFLQALQDQVGLLSNKTTKSARRRRKQADGSFAQTDVDVKVKSWTHSNSKGELVLRPRYGNTDIEFAPGRTALLVGDAKRLPEVLRQLIAATTAGEMDELLTKAAGTRKRPVRRAKKANGPALQA